MIKTVNKLLNELNRFSKTKLIKQKSRLIFNTNLYEAKAKVKHLIDIINEYYPFKNTKIDNVKEFLFDLLKTCAKDKLFFTPFSRRECLEVVYLFLEYLKIMKSGSYNKTNLSLTYWIFKYLGLIKND